MKFYNILLSITQAEMVYKTEQKFKEFFPSINFDKYFEKFNRSQANSVLGTTGGACCRFCEDDGRKDILLYLFRKEGGKRIRFVTQEILFGTDEYITREITITPTEIMAREEDSSQKLETLFQADFENGEIKKTKCGYHKLSVASKEYIANFT